jgi:hypothetical protein
MNVDLLMAEAVREARAYAANNQGNPLGPG